MRRRLSLAVLVAYFRPDSSRISVAGYCCHTGSLLFAGAHMGLSWQLPVLQLPPMRGHRERD